VIRILITGGSGFIGTNLVERYKAKNWNVLNLDAHSPRNKTHLDVWRKVDLLDQVALKAAIASFNPQYVFHLAARTDLDGKSLADYAANSTGTSNLILGLSTQVELKRVVFASSMLVCQTGYRPTSEIDYCPTTVYGKSKVEMEILVRRSTLIPCSWALVRPTSIWGPWFGMPYKNFFSTVASGYYFHPGRHDVRRSFGYVGNAVYELDRLMFADTLSIHGKTFYLADYEAIAIRHWANLIQQAMGVRPIRTIPVSLLKATARVGDIAKVFGWDNPPLTSFRLTNMLTPAILDLEPLKAIVGPLPYGLEEAVGQTITWMREHGSL
jgi:nucleoside-diphosphate-sugar epimerase